MADTCKPSKQQIGRRTQHGAQHQNAHHAQTHRQNTTNECADQSHDDAKHFANRCHFVFGVTHVHIKRIGHDAHHHIADAVDGDQQQDDYRLPLVAANEIRKWLDQGRLQPFFGVARRR